MKRKLALCLEYPIGQHGGTEVLVSELIRGLGNHHQILLISPDDETSLAQSSVADFVKEHIHFQLSSVSVKQAKDLAQQIDKHRPDLAHFHLGGNYAWACRMFLQSPIVHLSRLGIPCISTNHGAFTITDGICGPQRSWLFKAAIFLPAWLSKQLVLAHLKYEVTVSQNDYHSVRRWYPFVRHKFRRIYHSRIRETVPPLPNSHRCKSVLCAGTIGSRKGQTFLVEAFCRIATKFSDWKLILIGRPADEAMMTRIHNLISQHNAGNQVQLLGPCSDIELVEWFKQSAIFAMPSLYEGLGLSLQEAQFYGCACIGTRCGGVTDLIQDGDNGLLVPAGEVAPLADALERLMANESLRGRLSERGPKSVLEKSMTADKMVQTYERLYTDVLASHQNRVV